MQRAWKQGPFVALIIVVALHFPEWSRAEILRQEAPHADGQGTEHKSQDAKYFVYENKQYRFRFILPKSWKGYSIIVSKSKTDLWVNGEPDPNKIETLTQVTIRNPLWKEADPYQDIPIEVFTHAQWKLMEVGKLIVTAAPMNPSEMGRNSKYVFAIPPRYSVMDALGKDEVYEILGHNPLRPY